MVLTAMPLSVVTSLSAVSGVASAAVRVDVPVRPDRDTARGWAVEELAHREYQVARPGLLQRALQAIWDWLNQHGPDLPQGDGTRIVLVVLIFVLVGLVLYAVQRSGGLRRQSRRGKEAVFSGPARTAAGHRAAAEAAERDGQWATAVVERFRAITRELEERAVLVPH
ncbi:MAG TPA: hypothetical protein VFP72_24650, partial [Kineosporiaceae bacterium]|nr:hypothetical protein [Kineosporiaceae bacterium]